jgi:translocation and assembly module TamB
MRRWLCVGMVSVATLLAAGGVAHASILDRLLSWVSGSVATQGLAIHWGGELTADRVELRDPKGTYAALEHVTIQWSPLQLVHGAVDVSLLSATHAEIMRLPESSSGKSSMPSKIVVKQLRLDRLDVDKPVAGAAVALKVDASGRRVGPDHLHAKLSAERIGGGGTYDLSAALESGQIQAQAKVAEKPGGFLASVAGLPDIGPLAIDASVQGPRNDLHTQVAVQAGQMTANAQGQVNLEANTLVVAAKAAAPAMNPRPDLSWQSVALSANVHGAFTTPDVTANLNVDGLAASGAHIQRIAVQVNGNRGQVDAKGEVDGLMVPGPKPDLFAAAPVLLTVNATLDAADRPVRFTLHHPALNASGTLKTAGTQQADIQLSVPQIAPFASVAGVDAQGNVHLALKATREGGTTQASVDATVGVTGGITPAPALIGPSAHLLLAGAMTGDTVTLSHFSFDGQDLSLTAKGTASPQKIALGWTAALAHLVAIDPKLAGDLHANGQVGGSEQDVTLAADLAGTVAPPGGSSGPFTVHLDAQGLPHAPRAQVTAQGSLLGSPLQLAASGGKQPDGALHLVVRQADWKSASAHGDLTLPAGSKVPVGTLQFAVQRLADFSALAGRTLTGAVTATIDATSDRATLHAEAHNVGVPGTAAIGAAALDAGIADPTTHPAVDGTVSLTDIQAHGIKGSAKLTAKGPADQLAVQLAANVPNLDGAPARVATAGTVDVGGKALTLATLNANWKQQTLHLSSPVQFVLANGVTIRDLRLALSGATVQVNGSVGSALDLTASAKNLPVGLVSLISPGLPASGTLSADARLTGTTDDPAGTIRATASGLRLTTEAGRKLPAASITASATLQQHAARIDARAAAGTSYVTVSGRVPFSRTAPVDLRAAGAVDLALSDPLVAGSLGGGVEGHVTLAADVTGTVSRPAGTVRVQAGGVRLLTNTGRALPPAGGTAMATLNGTSARIDSRVTVGKSYIALSGLAPFSRTQPLDLRATGLLDLGITDPILTASGQRVNGTLTLAANIAGTAAAPRLSGTAQLSHGDIRDYVQGVHLEDVSARFVGTGDTLQIQNFTGRAGNGTIGGSGTIGVLQPDIPVNLTITARNATPLSGGVVTATVNADLAVRGEVERMLTLGGSVNVSQAIVRIPSKLPTSVVTIPVHIAGTPPAPPPKPGLSPLVALDLTVRAPEQIFLRGRGLNAELGGTVTVRGNSKQMLPRGAFNLIRGSFSLVGNTLNFTSGEITFGGASMTDPTLDLVATSVSSASVATLTVGGTAQNPKLTLSSVPDMPQDEILAQLLFHTNTGQLSPFQIASIAAGLAELSGSTSNFPNPLVGVQNALGLDQLGIGSGPNGQPTLQAGRYIGRRLYLGAQESTGGSGGQGTVQYNLTQGLKLNATVGAGQTTSAIGASGESSGASVGVTYQFQY